MAEKKLKLDDFKKKVTPLSAPQLEQAKGGYKLVSPGAGSVGHIQWDEIDFRNFGEGTGSVSEGIVFLGVSRGAAER